jgi:hypothetical protein
VQGERSIRWLPVSRIREITSTEVEELEEPE